MIYLVEINFTNPDAEGEWNHWYQDHQQSLVTVPGFETAQRFRAIGPAFSTYLAAYCVQSPEAFTSDAYRDNGGAGVASLRWKEFIRRRRALYAGIEWMPEIAEGARLLIADRAPAGMDLPNVLFSRIDNVGIDKVEGSRHLAVVGPDRVDAALTGIEGLAVYKPLSRRYVADRNRAR